jgi:P27 family predicted phage terminase small subunit
VKPRQARAPKHLQPATRRWYAQVARDYVLETHHLRLLQLAGEAWDRTVQAREGVDKHGLIVRTASGGFKTNPCIAIERDSRLSFARLLRELDLDVEPPGVPRAGPPALRSNRDRTH